MTKLEQFIATIEDTDECIEWPYSKRKSDGHGKNDRRGRVRIGKEVLYAYQAVFEYFYGRIEKSRGKRKFVVRHLCNNPSCCNPEHLTIGTHKQNAEDRKIPTALLLRCKGHYVQMTKGFSPTTLYALKPVYLHQYTFEVKYTDTYIAYEEVDANTLEEAERLLEKNHSVGSTAISYELYFVASRCIQCKCILTSNMSYRMEDDVPVCYDCWQADNYVPGAEELAPWTQPINDIYEDDYC